MRARARLSLRVALALCLAVLASADLYEHFPPRAARVANSGAARVADSGAARVADSGVPLVRPHTSARELYRPDYAVYHSVDAFDTRWRALVAAVPARYTRPRRTRVGLSLEGRALHAIELTDSQQGGNVSARAHVLLVFGEHARELLPVEVALRLLETFVTGMTAPCFSREARFVSRVLSRFVVHIVGQLNPDGRARLEASGDLCWRGNARGVDLNRNFAWQWGGRGSSPSAESEEYRGTAPLSEPESRWLDDYVAWRVGPVAQRALAVSFHTGIRHIYWPYADSNAGSSGGRAFAGAVASAALARRLAARFADGDNGRFEIGTAWQLAGYRADGTLLDHAAAHWQFARVLAVELWGNGSSDATGACFSIFNPPSAQLAAVLGRLEPALAALFETDSDAAADLADGRRDVDAALVARVRAAGPRGRRIVSALERTCELEDALARAARL